MSIKALETLMDIHQRKLDQMRRQMAQLQDQYEKFSMAIEGLKDELKQETDAATADISLMKYLGSYTKENQNKQTMITQARKRISKQIDEQSARIQEEFQSLKRYETTRDKLKAEEEISQKHKEQTGYDDMAVDRFIRKPQEE